MDVRAWYDRNRDRLNALYAGQDQYERYNRLAEAFRGHFNREPETFVSAPGRAEVVGNHTDHQNGKLLAAFYVAVLFALYLLNVPYMNYFVGGATVLTVLLTLRLKIVGANSLIQYKRAICRHGSTLEEMER